MEAIPTTAARPEHALPPRTLTQRQENYARCVASGMSYGQAFTAAGLVASTSGSKSNQIWKLNTHPRVAARVRELKIAADKAIESTYAERAAWLRLIIEADPAELSRAETDPCGMCWPEDVIALRMAACFTLNPFNPTDEPPPDMPVVTKPRHDCTGCRGKGMSYIVITPTEELSPAGRALFKGVTRNSHGDIIPLMHDQAAALDMLNKMHSSYVQKSLNLNANVAIHAARDVTTEDAARLFEAFE